MIYEHGPWFAVLVSFGPPLVIGLVATVVMAWIEKRGR